MSECMQLSTSTDTHTHCDNQGVAGETGPGGGHHKKLIQTWTRMLCLFTELGVDPEVADLPKLYSDAERIGLNVRLSLRNIQQDLNITYMMICAVKALKFKGCAITHQPIIQTGSGVV